MVPAPQVESYRRALQQLTSLAGRDLDELLRQVVTAVDARDGLLELLPRLVELYGAAAATLAADWYDEARELAETPGRFRAIPAELPGTDRTDSLAQWAVSPLFAAAVPDGARDLVLSKASGGLQRIIANASRDTVRRSSIADPSAAGWARRTAGGCDFCRMLAGRGAVYREETAAFTSHDHCHCIAVPVFDG